MPRSWQEPKKKFKRPPRGLSGREIGLFYRDQQIKMKKSENLINLKIPPFVITALYNNLKDIELTGRSLNISLKPFTNPNIKIRQEDDTNQRKDAESLRLLKAIKKNDELIDNDEISTPDFHPSSTRELELTSSSSRKSSTDNTKAIHMKSEDQLVMEISPGTSQGSIKKEPIAGKYDNCFDMPGPSSHVEYKSFHSDISFRGAGDFKYGYEDIVTGTFDEKLDACLAKNECISQTDSKIKDYSNSLRRDYMNMIVKDAYLKMMTFRQELPTYKKSKELLEIINNNQVVVISGETGCGKSTQVPQIILDDAILNNRGANVKILVTQPRRIAASSLAMRVAEERAEKLGNSVGYAVRLEKEEPRSRGSIIFCTTGILLADLEVNQGLTSYSHVILDEVHERDCNIDISMCMLKKVLNKRKDLKLILMSATIDAETLSAYFNNCPMLHIEGLAYPVKDFYLEDVLQMTKYKLPENFNKPSSFKANQKPWQKHTRKAKQSAADEMEKDIRYKAEISRWLEPIKKNLSREVYHTLQDSRIEELNMDLIFELLKCICSGEPGAILVFLPGIGDITKLLRMIRESGRFPESRYAVYPLHSKLPTFEQHQIFKRPPQHIRKIIIATNIAETSITIDDIVYVIDCGKIKYSGLNVEQNVTTLKTEWISQANLRQRRGRAGRCQAGICYHLVTSHRAKNLEERLIPELQRSNLLEPVLAIKKLRLGKANDALGSMPAPPAESTISSAVSHLHQLGALNEMETLTPLGWHLARLPVHPAAGKLLLLGALFCCLDRAASVAAVWGFKDPFMLVIGKERETDAAKRRFAIGEPSDHVAISEAIIQWEECGSYQSRRSFAHENYLSMNTLELLSEMKKQLGNNLKQMGFLTSGNVKAGAKNRNGNNLSLFKAIVAASLYPNIGTVRWLNLDANRLKNKTVHIKACTPEDGNISLHPSSVMQANRSFGSGAPLCDNPGANWLVYWLKQRSSDLFLIDVTLVYTLPLMFFGELKLSEVEGDPANCLIKISTVKVKCKRETTELLIILRSLLDRVLAAKIITPDDQSKKQAIFDEQVLNAVTHIITAEDEQVEYLGGEDEYESDQSECQSNQRRRYK